MRFIAVCLLCCCFSVSAQHFNGFLPSEFSGVLNARLNPAFIAGSPYKFDVSLINLNAYLANDFGYLHTNEIGNLAFERIINSENRFVIGDQTLGGLSGLFSISPKKTIAFQYQFRNLSTGKDITPNFGDRNAFDQSGEFVNNSWHEFGITYANVLLENKFERLKVGITAKLMGTLGSVFVDIDDLSYQSISNDSISLIDLEGQIGYSANLNEFEIFDGDLPFELPKISSLHPALDIGIAYEVMLSRRQSKAMYGIVNKPDILYQHRFGISILDVGVIKYDYGSASFDIINSISQTDPINYENLLANLSSLRSLRDSLATVANVTDLVGEYSVSLPTRLELNYDYHLRKGWFVNMSAQLDLSSLMNTDYRIHYPNSISVSPRYDVGQWGAYFPLYWNMEGDIEFGTGLRYGPLTVGTHSLGSLLSAERTSFGMFFNLSIHQLKSKVKRANCLSKSGMGTAIVRQKRTPQYRRKKFLFW